MNLDELRSVQSKERQKDSLQNLRPSFYREVGEYIAELKDERARAAEAAADPFSSPEVGRLTDEIETAKDVVEAIYERRMGKLVKQASLAAAGMPADDEGLTEEERELFADLVDRIRTNKSRVLDVLEWSEEATDGTDVDAEPVPEGPTTGSKEDHGAGGIDPAEAAAAEAGSEGEGVSIADVMGGDPTETETEPEPKAEATSTDSASRSTDPEPADAGSPGHGAEPGADGGPGQTDGGEGVDSPQTDPASDSTPDHDAGRDAPASARSETGGGAAASGSDGGRQRSADGGATSSGAGDVDRVTVRITRDVGSILGVDDREYTLADDDVVTLPERNATPLVERDAAEPIE